MCNEGEMREGEREKFKHEIVYKQTGRVYTHKQVTYLKYFVILSFIRAT
jgi:hypothetical protein